MLVFYGTVGCERDPNATQNDRRARPIDAVSWRLYVGAVDTAGHADGTMCWRWIGTEDHPELETRVVKLADIA